MISVLMSRSSGIDFREGSRYPLPRQDAAPDRALLGLAGFEVGTKGLTGAGSPASWLSSFRPLPRGPLLPSALSTSVSSSLRPRVTWTRQTGSLGDPQRAHRSPTYWPRQRFFFFFFVFFFFVCFFLRQGGGGSLVQLRIALHDLFRSRYIPRILGALLVIND